jgi:hypothetical protein
MHGEDALVVFTARSPDRIIREGGSQAWVLNPARAKLCKWLVCTQNRHHPDHEFSDASEPHGSAFLVGKISVIKESQEDPAKSRWHIGISDYALLSKPDVWQHWRNPVRYTALATLGINPGELEFQAMPVTAALLPNAVPDVPEEPRWPPRLLTIPEAKQALAATFGVSPEAVEIVIRG